MKDKKRIFDEAVMPGEKFVPMTGDIPEQYMWHGRNAHKVERDLLKGKNPDLVSVDLRLGAIRAETQSVIQMMLMETPDRFLTANSFVAEDLAFLYTTACDIREKKRTLAELERRMKDEEC